MATPANQVSVNQSCINLFPRPAVSHQKYGYIRGSDFSNNGVQSRDGFTVPKHKSHFAGQVRYLIGRRSHSFVSASAPLLLTLSGRWEGSSPSQVSKSRTRMEPPIDICRHQ